MRVSGGYTNYGQTLGILMLDTRFPRLHGDIGNARTFPFPVRYRTVRGASPSRVVLERDPALLEPFLAAARELEAEAVVDHGEAAGGERQTLAICAGNIFAAFGQFEWLAGLLCEPAGHGI